MISAGDVYGRQFIDAYKIHEICNRMGLTVDDARFYTYIHETAVSLGIPKVMMASEPAWVRVNAKSKAVVQGLSDALSVSHDRGFYDDVREASAKGTTSTSEDMLADIVASLGKGAHAYMDGVTRFHGDRPFNREKALFYVVNILPSMELIDVSGEIEKLKEEF